MDEKKSFGATKPESPPVVAKKEEHIPVPKVEPAESAKVLEKAKEILEKHGNLESNIPVNSQYWVLMNEHRALYSEEEVVKARERGKKKETK